MDYGRQYRDNLLKTAATLTCLPETIITDRRRCGEQTPPQKTPPQSVSDHLQISAGQAQITDVWTSRTFSEHKTDQDGIAHPVKF